MDRRTLGVGAAFVGAGVLAWSAYGAYVNRQAERVPYDDVDTIGDVELRRYPETVVVATRAESEDTAFRRLFEYISGANDSAKEVSMTAPVASDGRAGNGESEEVSMTAPVRTDREDERVRMEFVLPAEYTAASAPRPIDARVELVIRPSRTVAALPFSGYARTRKTRKNRESLLDTLDAEGVETVEQPTLLRYNAPYTPPFMRRNEVAVGVSLGADDG